MGWVEGMEPPTCAREIASSTGSKSQRHRVRKSIVSKVMLMKTYNFSTGVRWWLIPH